ncbi:MAG: hypothetical protein OEY75_07825, partial [Hylemonella sp.]|nr:hypothetical protein [Hylemonella sp.]
MTHRHSIRLSMLLVSLLLASCASHLGRGDEFAARQEWLQAVLEYRQASRAHPDDIEVRSRLRQTELKAAEHYYHLGLLADAQGDLGAAIGHFQQGLLAMPENEKLLKALQQAQSRKEAQALYEEGSKLLDAGKPQAGRQRLQKVLELQPGHQAAAAKLAQLDKQARGAAAEGLALNSNAPITLNFRETDIRDAYEFLTKAFGVNAVFDDSVKNTPITLFARDVTFEQGLSLLLTTSKTFYRKIGPNTILLAQDSKEKRGQYEDQVVRSFELNTVRAKDMADILKGVLTLKKVVINEQLNTLTIRDSEQTARLVERMIQNNDKKPAEVILDVEILEISRTKAENIGLDFGSYQVSAAVPTYPLTTSFADAARNTGTLTVPSATLHFFKRDVDGKTLANPRIRVLSGKQAKIHIGDRVPLIATTIQDATGQVRNAFDYKDIGIRLVAEPVVHIDHSVTVKLALEVSSLGQNLGTPGQPAYSIGSRNAETSMLLRDGETAILGGLIQDNERNTKVFLPGLGDIPAVGALFTNYNNATDRTDVLLTITPRVVRGWEQSPEAARQFFSGTENSYQDRQLFAELKTAAVSQDGAALAPRINTRGGDAGAPGQPALPAVAAPTVEAAEAAATPPQLAFAQDIYEVAQGQRVNIELTGQQLGGIDALPLELLYNPQVLQFVSGQAGP